MKYKSHKQYRLPYYNYASTGLYFVTICSSHRACIFGDVVNSETVLSPIGKIAEQCWNTIPTSSSYAAIDAFVIMPNHIHGILAIQNDDANKEIATLQFQPEKRSLSIVVRNFKAAVSLQARKQLPGCIVWQPRFYDRIIRSEKELHSIRNYIFNNPSQWEADKNNLDNLLM